jgi:hypothetical protein
MPGRRSPAPYRRASHFTLYWKLTPEERKDLAASRSTAYVANDALGQVMPGDVLWLVNIWLGDVYLLGRVLVATVVDSTEVAQQLVDSDIPWQDAEWYAISNRYHVEPPREVLLTPYLGQMRFADASVPGGPLIAHFRGLRALDADTARLFDDVWYQQAADAQDTQDFLELTEDDRAYNEGRVVVRTLRERQRSRALVQEAKKRSRRRYRELRCEACGFSFARAYGIDYIEAHHARQMASFSGEHQTTVDDLHLLCANCHRVVHTQMPPMSLQTLKHLIEEHKKKP